MEEMYFITLNESGTILRHPLLEKPSLFSSDVIACRLCGGYRFLRELSISFVKPYWLLFCVGCLHELMYHKVTSLSHLIVLRACFRKAMAALKETEAFKKGEVQF